MISTIITISKILDKEDIDYFISGGTSLFLRKLIDNTRDIDFIIKEKDKNKIEKLFKKELLFTKNNNFITFNKDGFKIEFTLITEEDNISLRVIENKKYEIITKNKYDIKIIPLKELFVIYKRIYLKSKKKKYIERIKLLEKINNN